MVPRMFTKHFNFVPVRPHEIITEKLVPVLYKNVLKITVGPSIDSKFSSALSLSLSLPLSLSSPDDFFLSVIFSGRLIFHILFFSLFRDYQEGLSKKLLYYRTKTVFTRLSLFLSVTAGSDWNLRHSATLIESLEQWWYKWVYGAVMLQGPFDIYLRTLLLL